MLCSSFSTGSSSDSDGIDSTIEKSSSLMYSKPGGRLEVGVTNAWSDCIASATFELPGASTSAATSSRQTTMSQRSEMASTTSFGCSFDALMDGKLELISLFGVFESDEQPTTTTKNG